MLTRHKQSSSAIKKSLARDRSTPLHKKCNDLIKRYEEASVEEVNQTLAEVEKALSQNADNASLWNDKGSLLLIKQEHAMAAECFRKAIALRPDKWAWYYHLAIALKRLGDKDQCAACCKTVPKEVPVWGEKIARIEKWALRAPASAPEEEKLSLPRLPSEDTDLVQIDLDEIRALSQENNPQQAEIRTWWNPLSWWWQQPAAALAKPEALPEAALASPRSISGNA